MVAGARSFLLPVMVKEQTALPIPSSIIRTYKTGSGLRVHATIRKFAFTLAETSLSYLLLYMSLEPVALDASDRNGVHFSERPIDIWRLRWPLMIIIIHDGVLYGSCQKSSCHITLDRGVSY